jgi:hypothetical protein
MSTHPFFWRLELASGEWIWTATVRQGTYTINQRRLTAQFIRLAPFASIEIMLRIFDSVENAQIYCELHWHHISTTRSGFMSRETHARSSRGSSASSAGSGLRRVIVR